jgi:hypothetical protein
MLQQHSTTPALPELLQSHVQWGLGATSRRRRLTEATERHTITNLIDKPNK